MPKLNPPIFRTPLDNFKEISSKSLNNLSQPSHIIPVYAEALLLPMEIFQI